MKTRLFTAILLLLTVTATSAQQDNIKYSGTFGNSESDILSYTFTTDSVLTISGDGKMMDYEMGEDQFPWKSSVWHNEIRRVILEDGVRNIGDYSFSRCENLSEVIIRGDIDTIGENAFFNCPKLSWLSIPNGVKSIRTRAFYYCSELHDITIPGSVSQIGDEAFAYCTGITDLTILNGVNIIGKNAFKQCSGISELIIPSSVESMGDSTFSYCENLSDVIIRNGITSLSPNVFSHCIRLKSASIPNSVTEICDSAFYSCVRLTEVQLHEYIKSIGEYAFFGCPCGDIVTPESLRKLGRRAFSCDSITWNSPDCETYGGLASVRKVKFGPRIKYINDGLFAGNSVMTSVTLPEGLTGIGEGAFSNWGLTCVIFPEDMQMTSIESGAFSYANGISHIEIPEGITHIGQGAFSENLLSITLPSTLQQIDYNFSENLGYGDTCEITCYASIPPAIPENWTVPGNTKLYVPCNLIDVYHKSPWSKHINPLNIIGISPHKASFRYFVHNDVYEGQIASSYNHYGNNVSLESVDCNSITIKAKPSGTSFICWIDKNGDTISYDNPYTVTITQDTSVFAVFKDEYIMNVHRCRDGIQIGYLPWDNNTYGSEVHLTAKLYEHDDNGEISKFSHWSVRREIDYDNRYYDTIIFSYDTLCSLKISREIISSRGIITIYANYYSVNAYTVKLTPNDKTMGSVSGGGKYGEGEVIHITATPKEGYAFLRWSDGNTDNPRTITVDGDIALQAIFESTYVPPVYTITLTSNDETMGSVSGGGEYEEGEEIEIFAIPKSGYSFVRWSDGNTDNPRTITVTQDTALTAYFSDGRTAVDGTSVSGGVYVTKDGILHIEGHDGEDMSLFTADGALLYEGTVRDYPLPQPGVYLLRIGSQTVKVVRP